MPRNTLKSFPTAALRRGLAHFHPACFSTIQMPLEPPGSQHSRASETPSPEVPPGPQVAPGPGIPAPENLEQPISA